MEETGNIALILSFFVSLYSVGASTYGIWSGRRDFIESAYNSLYVVFFLLTIASIALVHALLVQDYSLKYVAVNTSNDLSPLYRVTAFWAGQAGSLLLWSWMLSIYSVLVVWFNRHETSSLIPRVSTVMAIISAFFLFLIAFVESPFEKLPFTPEDGNGLNPLLQNMYMAIHPVCLYIGYVGITVPFAFGIGALLSGNLDDEWIKSCRRWALFAWAFLGVGLLLGARWAYLELGWGGYWAWDPVENAAFMPWLTATAFVHSVMIQEKRGMLIRWNMALIIITFFLALFGTFITRSGIVSSVHSFAQSQIGPYFLAFIALVLLASFFLFVMRFDRMKSPGRYESLLSKESAFLFNNLLLVAAALTVFLGTILPIITEAFSGERILVGPPYYNKINVPIGVLLILLMGIGPLISWRKASKESLIKNFTVPVASAVLTAIVLAVLGYRDATALISFSLCAFVTVTVLSEFTRGVQIRHRRGENYALALMKLVSKNRRRYGGYVVHLGIVLITVGITASSTFVTQSEKVLRPGESMTIRDYRVRFDGLIQKKSDVKESNIATLSIFKNDEFVGVLKPESNVFKYEGNRAIDKETEVALMSTFTEDFYAIMVNFEPGSGGRASFRVLLNPLVSWIWAGGLVLVFGAIITMWPTAIERRQEQVALLKYKRPKGSAVEV